MKVVYNKLLRVLTGNGILDKISIKKMLAELNWPSINQLSIQTRLEQAWKAVNIKDHTRKIRSTKKGERYSPHPQSR